MKLFSYQIKPDLTNEQAAAALREIAVMLMDHGKVTLESGSLQSQAIIKAANKLKGE